MVMITRSHVAAMEVSPDISHSMRRGLYSGMASICPSLSSINCAAAATSLRCMLSADVGSWTQTRCSYNDGNDCDNNISNNGHMFVFVFTHSFPVDTTKNAIQTWSILMLYLYSKQECRPQTLQQFGLGLKVNLQRQLFWFEHGFLDIGFQRLDWHNSFLCP